jgi:TolB-like protein
MDRAGGEPARVSLPPRTPAVRFAAFTLDLDGRSLSRADGGDVPLTHSEFALLREFVRHPGRVLSRDYLLDALAGKRADPFDRSIDMLVGRLRRKIEPDAKRPTLIVTAPGDGYKFVAPIEVHAESPVTAAASAPNKLESPRLSIVVLPFANIVVDAEQEYFVDGITESLTTDLSRIGGAFVIGRSTAFTFKGKPADAREIGRDLNVRYVLEGRVQRGGSRMRVNVQLIEAETGNHIWAERFDKPLADLFDMQDEIVARVARQLDAALISAEARRAAQSPEPNSMDLYFQGMAWANKGITLDHLARAGDFFERALALTPDNVGALTGNAWVEMTMASAYTTDDRAARLASAKAALARALYLAPDHAFAHLILARVEICINRGLEAIAECDRALALDRNLAAGHATIGMAKLFIGRAEETEAHVLEALRISPRDTLAFSWLATAGLARLYLGSDKEAVAWFRRAIGLDQNVPNAHFYLAAAFAHLGRLDEAKASLTTGLAINPGYTISGFRAGSFSDNPTFLAQRERVYDGLRKAGVPEG